MRCRFPKPIPRPKWKPTRIKRTRPLPRARKPIARRSRPSPIRKGPSAAAKRAARRGWSAAVLQRDQRCQMPWSHTCRGPLDPHHLWPAGAYPRLRLDVENGMVLCRAAHDEATRDAGRFREWLRLAEPERYARLAAKAQREGRLS